MAPTRQLSMQPQLDGLEAFSSSPVCAQLRSWAGAWRTPGPSLVLKRSRPALRRKVLAILQAGSADELAELRKLRRRAMLRAELPKSATYTHLVNGTASAPHVARPVRASGKRPRKTALKEEKAPASHSKSGRAVKTPSKFFSGEKERRPRATDANQRADYTRHRLNLTSSRGAGGIRQWASGAKPSGPRPSHKKRVMDPETGVVREMDSDDEDTEVRVGEAYQVDFAEEPDPETCLPRGDTLLWHPSSAGKMTDASLRSYVDAALPFVGGATGNPPTCSSAQLNFPTELAYQTLHKCEGDTAAALRLLSSGTLPREREWAKIEERHFRAAFGKHKRDLGQISAAVKGRTRAEVVRMWYVEEGTRQRSEREKRKELELMRQQRQAGSSSVGCGASSSLSAPSAVSAVSRTSTPHSNLYDVAGSQDEEGEEEEGEEDEDLFVEQ